MFSKFLLSGRAVGVLGICELVVGKLGLGKYWILKTL